MNGTLERRHRAAVIRIVIRNFSRNFLFSAYTKCLNKPAASTEAVTQKMKVYNQIVTHEFRLTLTSSYFFTWKRSSVSRPMGEHLVWVRPQEGQCSSLPVRGICPQEGHCSSLPVGVRPQEGHCSSLPVSGVRPQEGHCSSSPVGVRPQEGQCSSSLVGVRPQEGHCSSFPVEGVGVGGTSSRRTLF